jgi:hypothetical protein
MGEAKLGEARLETWPTARGMQVDQLRTSSKSVQISASGDWNGTAVSGGTKTPNVWGLFYGHGGAGQLGAQLIGVLVLCTVMFGMAYAFFKISDKVMKGGIRSDRESELAGLDIPEMGIHGYNDESLTGFEHEYVPRKSE